MRAKSMILIFIALGCGLVASIGISQVIDSKGKQNVTETVEILLAATDLNIGEEITESHVKIEAWPKNLVQPNAVTDIEEIKGHFARARFFPGEPILMDKLMESRESPLSSIKIPEGYRVMSVKVSMEKAVSNLVVPGDRVDIIAFLRSGNGISTAISKTILTDVRVFAVNSETDLRIDDGGKKIPARAVSLLVKPDQIEILDVADRLGQLRLSLRRPDDDAPTITEGKTASELFNPDALSSDRTSVGSALGSGLLEMVANGMQQTAQTPSGPTTPDVIWETEILTPTGSRSFHWTDVNKLPVESFSLQNNLPPVGNSDDQDVETSEELGEGETSFTEKGI